MIYRFMPLVLAVAALALGPFQPAAAQDASAWPAKPVTILVGSAAGGLQDAQARLLADDMRKVYPDQPFVVVDVPGAGGIASALKLLAAPADGYTILIASSAPMGLAAASRSDLTYDFRKDFIPVGQFSQNFLWVMINPKNIPAKTLPELVQILKASPDKYNYATSGVGSLSHIQTELFMLRTGTKVTHIPFKSTREMTLALLSGTVDMQVSAADAIDQVRSGQLRVLAVTGGTRVTELPDVPSIREFYPTYDNASVWQGIFVRAGTAPVIVERLNKAMNTILNMPESAARLTALGFMAAPSTPAQFADLVSQDAVTWAQVVKASGIKLE